MSGSARHPQLVAVAFREGDQRTYTYHNDGEPVAIGDRVMIPNRSGGQQRAFVVALPTEAPQFETKAIIGLAPPADEPPAVPQF